VSKQDKTHTSKDH
jgi:hypothetical protein